MTMPEMQNEGGARLIDGKSVAAELRETLSVEVEKLKSAHGLTPDLAVVLVGEDPASQVYVRNKEKAAKKAGMHGVVHRLPADTTQDDLLKLVDELNADAAIHGILVQLPLPGHIDEAAVTEAIDPDKDVDGLHLINIGRLAGGEDGLFPCTPTGCMILLKRELGDLTGLNAVIVGRSNLVGKPVAQMLLAENCTVTIAHSRTQDLPAVCRAADILVVAVGRAGLVRGDWVKPGATVIDVGINRDADSGKLLGDVAFDEAVSVAGAITPVPGGVGPMTIACLLANTVTAACRAKGIEPPELV